MAPLLALPQPPDGASPARPGGSYPRRPLPAGAGAVFVAPGARAGERHAGVGAGCFDGEAGAAVVGSLAKLSPRQPELSAAAGAGMRPSVPGTPPPPPSDEGDDDD